MVNTIEERIKLIKSDIYEVAKRCGRSPQSIKLMGVSKYHPVEAMLEASEFVDYLGENKVQEAGLKREKWPTTNKTPVHLIGHLQKNKARKALDIFDLIESVDSVSLAERLDRILVEAERTKYPVYVEVNMSGEESKSGVSPENAEELISYVLQKCSSLRLEGLMTIAPNTDDEIAIRNSFIKLRKLRDDMEKKYAVKIPELSMGMSGDYRIAIEEGSTIVRIGTAIFGKRNYQNQ